MSSPQLIVSFASKHCGMLIDHCRVIHNWMPTVWQESEEDCIRRILTFWHQNLAFKFEHTLYVKCE
jgi:hypothetical protein